MSAGVLFLRLDDSEHFTDGQNKYIYLAANISSSSDDYGGMLRADALRVRGLMNGWMDGWMDDACQALVVYW